VPSLNAEVAAASRPKVPTPTPTGWMLRKTDSGDVYRFRELTTLQQWIVERKVSRDDEISRSGDSWKRLGGIAELASFFHVVEQAEAVARADGPRAAAEAANAAYQRHGDDPALVTTAPMAMPGNSAPLPPSSNDRSGPTSMGNPVDIDEPAFTRGPAPGRRTKRTPLPPLDEESTDTDFEMRPRRRGGLWAGLLALAVLGGAGAYVALYKADAVRLLFAHPDARAEEAYRQGREYFLLDSDDAFRNAVSAFQRARAVDAKSALPLAGLAEVDSTWAQYLRDEAKALESGGASLQAANAARTLKREAQAHVDEASKLTADALELDSDAAEVNRAMADYLRVDGAAAAEVQRYLTRATTKRPNDPECAYVAGALALRDGQLDEAKAKLTQANQLNQAATQHTLLRASMLLARIDISTGDKAAARSALQSVLLANGQHDRAKTMLAALDGEPAAVAAAVPNPPAPATTPAPPTTPSPTSVASGATVAPTAATPTAAAPATAKADTSGGGEGGGYDKLVAQGDRLSENGHAREARKLYEKALQLQPSGLGAITGLGYCDLDGEKFSSAVDHFKHALSLQASYGEAIIGLAEAYKLRGDKREAASWYKQYLDKLPNGPKAAMARNNVRDLEPRGPGAPPPSLNSPPAADDQPRTTLPPPPSASAPPPSDAPKLDAPKVEPAKAEEPKDDKPSALPKLPSADEPPP
jgi:Tfp pilus assembly protein PilF